MLLLDSEALSAEAHGPTLRQQVVRAAIAAARDREEPIATSAAVLAEVVRGKPRDAGIHAALRRERIAVMAVDGTVGIRAGRLLEATGSGSERAVDAFLVATGDPRRSACVLTSDLGDIRLLAAHASDVHVLDLDAP